MKSFPDGASMMLLDPIVTIPYTHNINMLKTATSPQGQHPHKGSSHNNCGNSGQYKIPAKRRRSRHQNNHSIFERYANLADVHLYLSRPPPVSISRGDRQSPSSEPSSGMFVRQWKYLARRPIRFGATSTNGTET